MAEIEARPEKLCTRCRGEISGGAGGQAGAPPGALQLAPWKIVAAAILAESSELLAGGMVTYSTISTKVKQASWPGGRPSRENMVEALNLLHQHQLVSKVQLMVDISEASVAAQPVSDGAAAPSGAAHGAVGEQAAAAEEQESPSKQRRVMARRPSRAGPHGGGDNAGPSPNLAMQVVTDPGADVELACVKAKRAPVSFPEYVLKPLAQWGGSDFETAVRFEMNSRQQRRGKHGLKEKKAGDQ